MFINVGCVDSYREDCRYPCSTHCVNNTCNRYHGRCVFGCDDGFIGEKCNRGTRSIRFADYCFTSLSLSLSPSLSLSLSLSQKRV